MKDMHIYGMLNPQAKNLETAMEDMVMSPTTDRPPPPTQPHLTPVYLGTIRQVTPASPSSKTNSAPAATPSSPPSPPKS